MKLKAAYTLYAAIIFVLVGYLILINYRPYTTEGILKFNCCDWIEKKIEK